MAKTNELTLEIDDSGLQRILDGLGPELSVMLERDVLKSVQKLLLPIAKAEAVANGFGRAGRVTNGKSTWLRLGRIPRALSAGKVYRKNGVLTARLYIKVANRHGLMNSAPHANIVIPGRKDGSIGGRSVMGNAKMKAPDMMQKAVDKAIDAVVRRARRRV